MEVQYLNIHQEIIDRCQAGDKKAYGELYQLYSKAMFNVCLRMVNNQQEAEDILQEAFVGAFKNLRNYRSESTFGAWLKRIVINKTLNHIKKRKLELFPLEDNTDRIEEDVNQLDEESTFNIHKIKKAIELLPDGYRMVFSLYVVEGYDHGEIASIMNITESTSKSQYNRAKKKVRSLIEKL